VEVFLYFALFAWIVGRAWSAWRAAPGTRLDWLLPSATHRALAGLAIVMLLSAATASTGRPAAFKFTLRSLGGIALFWASADLLAAPGAAALAAGAVGAGAVAAALLTAAEVRVHGAAALLRPFHAQTFQSFGLLRASGPFQYPNIAAMFLEASLPLWLAAGVSRARRGVGPMVLTVLGGALIFYAVLLTSSRAGIATALLELLVLAIWAGRRTPLRHASALALALGLATLAMPFFARESLLAMRLQVWQSRPWYRSVIAPSPGPGAPPLPGRLSPGRVTWVRLSVRNEGTIVWPSRGSHVVSVSYHWSDASTGDMLAFEGARTPLPHDVAPGGAVVVWAKLRAPDDPGMYIARWDLVQENVTWFSVYGDPGMSQRVEVTWSAGGARRSGASSTSSDDAPAATVLTPPEPDTAGPSGIPRKQLWIAALRAWRAHPLLGLGPDNFRHLFGSYLNVANPDDRLHANSFYLEVLATLGLVGFLAFGAVGVTLGRAARQALRRPAHTPVALATCVALGAYLVHGLLDYFLEFTPTYALFWLLAGTLVALARDAGAMSPPGALPADPALARAPTTVEPGGLSS
jgi:O-antigen ligase/polysaccharide polymerase Wzy-like membrane protein/Ig-like domain-containing protein